MGLERRQAWIGRLAGLPGLQLPPLQRRLQAASQALFHLRQLLRGGVGGPGHLDCLVGLQQQRQRLGLQLLLRVHQVDRNHRFALFQRNRHLAHTPSRALIAAAHQRDQHPRPAQFLVELGAPIVAGLDAAAVVPVAETAIGPLPAPGHQPIRPRLSHRVAAGVADEDRLHGWVGLSLLS